MHFDRRRHRLSFSVILSLNFSLQSMCVGRESFYNPKKQLKDWQISLLKTESLSEMLLREVEELKKLYRQMRQVHFECRP